MSLARGEMATTTMTTRRPSLSSSSSSTSNSSSKFRTLVSSPLPTNTQSVKRSKSPSMNSALSPSSSLSPVSTTGRRSPMVTTSPLSSCPRTSSSSLQMQLLRRNCQSHGSFTSLNNLTTMRAARRRCTSGGQRVNAHMKDSTMPASTTSLQNSASLSSLRRGNGLHVSFLGSTSSNTPRNSGKYNNNAHLNISSIASLRSQGVTRSLSSSSSLSSPSNSYHGRNTLNNNHVIGGKNSSFCVQVAQRSNGSAVKAVIDELKHICDTRQQLEDGAQKQAAAEDRCHSDDNDDDDGQQLDAPIQQCSMLAQWCCTDDEYYRIIITKYDGIGALLRSMDVFRDSHDIQSLCCQCLIHLSKSKLFEGNATRVILQAMETHPNHEVIQSNALQALRGLVPIILMKMRTVESTEPGQAATAITDRDAILATLDDIRRVSKAYLSIATSATAMSGTAAATDIINVLDAMVL